MNVHAETNLFTTYISREKYNKQLYILEKREPNRKIHVKRAGKAKVRVQIKVQQ